MEKVSESSLESEAYKENKILSEMFKELEKADRKYTDDKMSPEEIKSSFMTLKCECTELEREVERIKKRPKAMEKEAVQTLAMAYKFLRDVIYADI